MKQESPTCVEQRGRRPGLKNVAPSGLGSNRPKCAPRPLRVTKLILTVTADIGNRYAAALRYRLRQAHAVLRPALRELSVAIVGDRAMARLHEQFMGIPGPTDVLTFELDHDARGRVIGGEGVIPLGEARRQAKLRGHPIERELLLYAIHGMLHLCSFDDRSGSGFAAMHRMEDHILESIGVGAVFARPTSPALRRARHAEAKRGRS
jgi:rRNA maturation RNase YbeY